MSPPSVVDHTVHTPYSDPGDHAARIAEAPTDPTELGAVARNVIVHYRASGHELPAETRDEMTAAGWRASSTPTRLAIHGRWPSRGR